MPLSKVFSVFAEPIVRALVDPVDLHDRRIQRHVFIAKKPPVGRKLLQLREIGNLIKRTQCITWRPITVRISGSKERRQRMSFGRTAAAPKVLLRQALNWGV